MAAVHKDHAIGVTACAPERLKQGQKAAIASTPKPTVAIRSWDGGDRVAHTHKQRHPVERKTGAGQVHQTVMVARGGAHVEVIPEWKHPITTGDVAVDQHQ